MLLAHAIAVDEDSLVCDFAEYYHLYDYKALPLRTAAALCSGLGADSRIMRKLSGSRVDSHTMLLAIIADRLGQLLWQNSADGQKGRNRPKSIYAAFVGQTAEGNVRGFDTPEAFEAALQAGREGR